VKDKDMNEFFETVQYDDKIEFTTLTEEQDDEDDTDSLDDVIDMYFPWSRE